MSFYQLLQDGNKYLLTKNYKKAVKCFTKITKINPKYTIAWVKLSHALIELGEIKKADTLLKKMRPKFPNDPHIIRGFGHLFIAQEKYSNAKKFFLNATKVDVDCAEAWLDLGNFYLMQNELPDAGKCFSHATKLDPDMVDAILQLGNVYVKVDNINEAERLFKKVIEKDPYNETAIRYMGVLSAKQGKFEEAETFFNKALDNNQEGKEINYNLALLKLKDGDFAGAEELMKKEEKLDSKNVKNLVLATYIYKNLKEDKKGHTAWTKAMNQSSLRAKIYIKKLQEGNYY